MLLVGGCGAAAEGLPVSVSWHLGVRAVGRRFWVLLGYWRGLTRRVVTFRWGLFRSAFKAQGREVAAADTLTAPNCHRCLCRFHGDSRILRLTSELREFLEVTADRR